MFLPSSRKTKYYCLINDNPSNFTVNQKNLTDNLISRIGTKEFYYIEIEYLLILSIRLEN